jgi:hypothetical protein
MEYSLTRCDECKRDFPIKLRTRKNNGIEENFFTCPHCKKNYVSFVTNKEIRRKQREIVGLRRRIARQQDPVKRDMVYQRYLREKDTVGKMMQALKEKCSMS